MRTVRINLTWNKIEPRFWVPVICLALLAAFVFVRRPFFYDKNFGVSEDEANAVFSLLKIHGLEKVYATAHPDLGYACQLKQLQPAENAPPEVSYATPINFQVGESAGYKFEIVGCAPDKDGVLAHYQVTAVPLKPGLSGVQAFCTDESGSVFYDLNGSASECLAAKRHTVPWTSPD